MKTIFVFQEYNPAYDFVLSRSRGELTKEGAEKSDDLGARSEQSEQRSNLAEGVTKEAALILP